VYTKQTLQVDSRQTQTNDNYITLNYGDKCFQGKTYNHFTRVKRNRKDKFSQYTTQQTIASNQANAMSTVEPSYSSKISTEKNQSVKH